MSESYRRLEELLDRWMASVEAHSHYLALDDAAYARVQEWPKHQRPTKWVVELARTRLLEMKKQLAARREQSDEAFAESLELMSFLTNLLGSEHIDRFIPLAARKASTAASATVKRPRLKLAEEKPVAKPESAVKTRPAPAAATPAPATPAPARARAAADAAAMDKATATVIADAVRFLGWGREWPALASQIARLADRPPETEVWRILRAHRERIEREASRRPKPPDRDSG